MTELITEWLKPKICMIRIPGRERWLKIGDNQDLVEDIKESP